MSPSEPNADKFAVYSISFPLLGFISIAQRSVTSVFSSVSSFQYTLYTQFRREGILLLQYAGARQNYLIFCIYSIVLSIFKTTHNYILLNHYIIIIQLNVTPFV